MFLQEQLARMAEGDAVRAHHPVDHRAAGSAPEAVPEISLRRHDAARGLIPLVPGTAAGQVLALGGEPVPLRLDQAHEGDLALQALELSVRDSCHMPHLTAWFVPRGKHRDLLDLLAQPIAECSLEHQGDLRVLIGVLRLERLDAYHRDRVADGKMPSERLELPLAITVDCAR